MLGDVKKGRATEVEAINGAVVAAGLQVIILLVDVTV